MADERTVIFKLELDSKALTNSAKEAQDQLARLTPELKRVADESGKNSVEYRKLEAEVQKYTKQLKDSSAALAINEELAGKTTLTTIEQARAKKALSTAYNMLTEDEKRNTEEGKRLTAQLKATNEALQEQGLAVSDGRGSVGLYEKAIKAALGSLSTLEKQSTTIGYAIGQNTKKVEDGTKALAEMRAKGIAPTDKAYQDLSQEVEFYTKAVDMNKQALSEVEAEMQSQTQTLKETEKQAAQIGFVYGQNEEATKSLKTQLKELKAELATLDPNSEAFIEGTKRAGELADKMKDVNEAVGAQASGSVFEQLSNQAGLLGQDLANLDFEGVAEKAKGFQAIASRITLKEMVGGVKNAGSALVSLGTTLLASPIFWLVGAGVAIYAFWDDLKGYIIETDAAQEALNATMEDFSKGATEASKKTMDVETAFKLARKGVISKDEALKTYNDTLGGALGTSKDFNEAEQNFIDKTDEFIKASALRAQYTAMLDLAAQERAKGFTASMESQIDGIDLALVGFDKLINGQESATKKAAKYQQEGVKETQKAASQKASIIEKEAQRLLEEAEMIENQAGIKSETEQKLNDELAKLAKERADKAREAAEARAEAEKQALENIRDLILGNEKLSNDLRQRELDARVKFLKNIASTEYTEAGALAKRLLEIEEGRIAAQKQLDQEVLDDRIKELKQAAAEEIALLDGTAQQIEEQRRLINERTNADIQAARLDFSTKELDAQIALEDAKNAVKDASLAKEQQRLADQFTILDAELSREETRLREAGATEEEIAAATAQKRIDLARKQYETIANDATKSDAEKLKAQAEYEAALFAIKKEGYDKDVAAAQEAEETKKTIRDASIDAVSQLVADFYDIAQQRIVEETNAVNEASLAQQEALASKLEAGIISQEKYNAELKKIEIKKTREEARLKKEAFEKQKQADLVQAGISIAKSVLAAMEVGPPAGFVLAALAAALGAVQLAKIASSEAPAFAEGGRTLPIISGKKITASDGAPIWRANGDNLLATVKTNEVILNEEHQRRAGGAAFFRSIGVPGFAQGGSTGATIASGVDVSNANNVALLDAMARMRSVVDVKDIIGQVNQRVDVVDGANLF